MLLGIDIGTTKVACVIINNGKQISVKSINHQSYLTFNDKHAEQDADTIITATINCIKQIDEELLHKVSHIGISCQMHGLVLTDNNKNAISPLYTWQDKRVSDDECGYLSEISNSPVYSGYGCATLYSLIKNNLISPTTKVAVTIGDYLNMKLFNAKPAIDPANAASWGFYDQNNQCWNREALKSAGIPETLLPEIVPFNTEICHTSENIFNTGIPVSVATGDNQSSIAASMQNDETEIYLTLGTGGQLSVLTKDYPQYLPFTCEIRPFPGNKHLMCCATLNGGAAWQWFANYLKTFPNIKDNVILTDNNIFEIMNNEGIKTNNYIEISPRVFGERNEPEKISSRDLPLNLCIGELSAGFARGIIRNLRNMMPELLFKNKKIIILSGNALRKNPVLVKAVTEIFGLPVKISKINEEAATGAAIFYQLSQ